jgi:hypothetical protein
LCFAGYIFHTLGAKEEESMLYFMVMNFVIESARIENDFEDNDSENSAKWRLEREFRYFDAVLGLLVPFALELTINWDGE